MRENPKFYPVTEFVCRFRLLASHSDWNAGCLAATLAMLAGVPAASFAADMAVPTKAAPAPACVLVSATGTVEPSAIGTRAI